MSENLSRMFELHNLDKTKGIMGLKQPNNDVFGLPTGGKKINIHHKNLKIENACSYHAFYQGKLHIIYQVLVH